MNNRTNFIALLQKNQQESVVWTADLSYWIEGRKQDGTADPAWETEEGYLSLHADLGVMPYYYYDKFWTAESIYDKSIRVEETGDENLIRRTFQTPRGTLIEEKTYMPESACYGVTRYPVNSPKELDILLYILEHRTLLPDNLKDYSDRLDIWERYDGIPSLGLPRAPLSALTYEWTGIQNLVYLMMDCPDKIETILTLLEQQEESIIEAVCECGPIVLHFPDNLSSDNFTGYYDRYMSEHYRRRLNRLHDAGIRCAVHLDGTVRGLLPKLAADGFDAIEALTPRPGGDLPVEDMRPVAVNDQVILWGGMPGIMFSPPYSWSDVEKHIDRVLDCLQGEPFVLGVADQVPPDGNIEFVRRISETIKDK